MNLTQSVLFRSRARSNNLKTETKTQKGFTSLFGLTKACRASLSLALSPTVDTNSAAIWTKFDRDSVFLLKKTVYPQKRSVFPQRAMCINKRAVGICKQAVGIPKRAQHFRISRPSAVTDREYKCVAVCCSVLQCVAVCCSVLQRQRIQVHLLCGGYD